MYFPQFRPFGTKEINEAITRFAIKPRSPKINVQTVRRIGGKLVVMSGEQHLSEAELINVCVTDALRPTGDSRRRRNVEPHPAVVESYLVVVRDIITRRSTSASGAYDAGRCIRPALQRSAAATA